MLSECPLTLPEKHTHTQANSNPNHQTHACTHMHTLKLPCTHPLKPTHARTQPHTHTRIHIQNPAPVPTHVHRTHTRPHTHTQSSHSLPSHYNLARKTNRLTFSSRLRILESMLEAMARICSLHSVTSRHHCQQATIPLRTQKFRALVTRALASSWTCVHVCVCVLHVNEWFCVHVYVCVLHVYCMVLCARMCMCIACVCMVLCARI